jgi:hypothetical protein
MDSANSQTTERQLSVLQQNGLRSLDPGVLTRAVLPGVQVLSGCAAVLAVGSLLLAAALVPPQVSGYLDTGGYAAVRTARIAA